MTALAIIGGGIAGLVGAALAHARGRDVAVIEASKGVGGLWHSTKVELGGYSFILDAGLRLPVATGDARLDGLLFHRPDFAFDWSHLDGWPREGAITAGRFNPENSCLDATMLGEALHGVIAEMRGARQGDEAPASALDYAVGHYGPTLAHGLIQDAVHGLFGRALAELDAKAVQWFVPRRIILGDSAATAALLEDPALSGRVAHARHADLPAGANRPFLRPSAGGISTWIDALHASLAHAGVRFILEDGLDRIVADHGRVRAIILRSGERLDIDQLLCTTAPSRIAEAVGLAVPPSPLFRQLRISHVLIDGAPGHQASYCLNFNRDARFFRAIFHRHPGELPLGLHVVSFEHLVADGDRRDLAAAEAVAECASAGALPVDARIIDESSTDYRNSVPVATLGDSRAAAKLRETLCSFTNLHFAGRSAGGAPFLDQIIREIDRTLDAMAGAYTHD
ncbi:NAD(P)-binding protein [Sphingobium sp. CR2-8]|uniref:NAD(P)-binding protein n=1 Tax=Sphingobium sp. CR2-8 TaxID=1306534 RepID=UPI002DBECB76|nr:NAD(P)-binding protein [Sphingobium sp. CR2-8]MEC3909144.1 NAD(P)-binding protein [Sphingobium sp. CR2-8]